MHTHTPTIGQYAQSYHCSHIIHGHVHQAQQYSTQYCHITVLDSWEHQDNVALSTPEGINLITYHNYQPDSRQPVLKEPSSTSM